MLAPMDVDYRLREIRRAAGGIEMQMRLDDVAPIARGLRAGSPA